MIKTLTNFVLSIRTPPLDRMEEVDATSSLTVEADIERNEKTSPPEVS